MEIKKKKRVLLEYEDSDWLLIWTVASSHDVKGHTHVPNSTIVPMYTRVYFKIN